MKNLMQHRFHFITIHVVGLSVCLAAFAVMATRTGLVFAQKPPLTGCSVGAFLVRAPNPSFVNEETFAKFSATYVKPTSTAECDIDDPVWSWAFDSGTPIAPVNPVERKNPAGMWVADPYRPTIIHIAPSTPNARLVAAFPRAGEWRVNLVVTAAWNSTECTSCTDDDKLVVSFPDVTDCSFSGVSVPENNFFGRSTTRVGVKEPGKLETRFAEGTTLADVEPLTWTCLSGGDLFDYSDNGDGTMKFEANFHTGRAVFELTSPKIACTAATVTLDVIAPAGVQHTFLRNHPGSGIRPGPPMKVQYHILNTVHLLPKDVSFQFIEVGEGEDDKAEMTGEFERVAKTPPNDPNAPHLENGPYKVTPGDFVVGSCWVPPDEVGPRAINVDGEAGRFVWEIPQQWFGFVGVRHDFGPKLTMRCDFDGKRTIRIQKGGVDRSGP